VIKIMTDMPCRNATFLGFYGSCTLGSERCQMSSTAKRFESLLEAVPDALVGMDQTGIIRFVNRQTESLFGYDRDQLIGRHIDMLVPQTLWQIYVEHKQTYFADPRTRSSGLDVELTGRQQDGTELPVNVSLSHIDTGDVLLVITAVRDVSRQQRAVKDAGLTAAIVKYSDDAIIGVNLQGTITAWNPAATRMYGWSADEAIGRFIGLLIPGDREGELPAAAATVRSEPHVAHLETDRLRKDGTVVPVSITVAPILDDDGEMIGGSAVHRDVTELKRAERYARGLIEADPDPLGMVGPDGTIRDVNEATVKATGVSREELIGTDFAQYFTDPDVARGGVQWAFEHGSLTDGRLTVRHHDGTLTDYLCNATVYRDIDGEVLGVLTSARDISSQSKAFETAQRMAAIVESSGDAIISATLEGVITSWNPAAQRMYGRSGAEVIGKSADILFAEDRTDEMPGVVEEIRAGQHVRNFETVSRRKDGTMFSVRATISPVCNADGEVVGVSYIVRDVTT